MTLEALAVQTHDVADSVFDFSRPAAEPLVATDSAAALAAARAEPEAGRQGVRRDRPRRRHFRAE